MKSRNLDLTFGQLVRMLRMARGLSLRVLGEESGIPYWRLFAIEHGAPPKDDEARRLCAVLGLETARRRGRRR